MNSLTTSLTRRAFVLWLALCAALVLCEARGVAQTDAPPPDKGAEGSQSAPSKLAAESVKRFEDAAEKLKTLSAELQARLDRAPKSAGFDRQQLEQEFRTLLSEPDLDKRSQRVEEFRARYEQIFAQQLSTAGIDAEAERGRMRTLLGFSSQTITPEALRDARPVLAVSDEPVLESKLPPTETAPVEFRDLFRAPYTGTGAQGMASANSADGFLQVGDYRTGPAAIETSQHLASVTQNVPVRRGAYRMSVTAELDEIDYTLIADAFGGYATSTTIINLRVLEGSRLVASRSFDIASVAATVIGFGSLRRTGRAATLSFEFDCPLPTEAGTYTVVVEFEGLAHLSGLGQAGVYMRGRVESLTVTTR